jgi:AcrR family transcriptional regulator
MTSPTAAPAEAAARHANRQGAATRHRLLRTAERLFAAQGVDAVSVRAVNAAAGLGPASVHYHFGSKEKLLEAVLLDMGRQVRDAISAAVDELAARSRPPTPAEVVHALADPYRALLFDRRTRGLRWVRIVVQVAQQGRPAVTATGQDELAVRLRAQLGRAFPDTPRERLDLRWPVAVMGFLTSLAQAEDFAAARRRPEAAQLAAYVEDLIEFTIGGTVRMLAAAG